MYLTAPFEINEDKNPYFKLNVAINLIMFCSY